MMICMWSLIDVGGGRDLWKQEERGVFSFAWDIPVMIVLLQA
jgi:hypothetical protein